VEANDPFLPFGAKRGDSAFRVSSSIAQLLGQNKSVKKVKPGLFCRILFCLSELNGAIPLFLQLVLSLKSKPSF
jgi:hypothetical protein